EIQNYVRAGVFQNFRQGKYKVFFLLKKLPLPEAPLRNRRNAKRQAQSLVHQPVKMGGQPWGAFLLVLMKEKVNLLKSLAFPACQTFDPVFKSLLVEQIIGADEPDKGHRAAQMHM